MSLVLRGDCKTPPLGPHRTAPELIETARSDGVHSALQDYVAQGGSLQFIPNLRRGLEIMTQPVETGPRFVPGRVNIVLRPWQEEHLRYLNDTPTVRRIFLVSGPPPTVGGRALPATWNRSMKEGSSTWECTSRRPSACKHIASRPWSSSMSQCSSVGTTARVESRRVSNCSRSLAPFGVRQCIPAAESKFAAIWWYFQIYHQWKRFDTDT